MHHPPPHRHILTLALTTLALSACGKNPADNPPLSEPPASAANSPASDPSLPSAASVFMPASAASRPDAAQGRANNALTAADESAAMPLPGQNNDHSAPVVPAKASSRP